MSDPAPVTANVPFVADALPATPTAPMSRLAHGAGNVGGGGGGGAPSLNEIFETNASLAPLPYDDNRTSAAARNGATAVTGMSAECVDNATTALPDESSAIPTPPSSRLPPMNVENRKGCVVEFVSNLMTNASLRAKVPAYNRP